MTQPQSRIEQLIRDLIDGATTAVQCQSRVELCIKACIVGDSSIMEPAQSRVEQLWHDFYSWQHGGTVAPAAAQSRVEGILRSIITGTEYTDRPQSRVEELLIELAESYRGVLVRVEGNPATLEGNVGATAEEVVIKGKTVCWNQLNESPSKSFAAGTYTTGNSLVFNVPNTPVNHKHLLCFAEDTTGFTWQVLEVESPDNNWVISGNYAGINWGVNTSVIVTPTTYGNLKIRKNATSVTLQSEKSVKLYIIDLTQLFGSGNEPTTVDDERIKWAKAYATAHPEYDAGSLVSVEDAVVTVSTEGGTEYASVAIPVSELRSAGSVADEYSSKGEGVVKVGVRAYQSGDESDSTVTTDGTTTYYPLASPVTTTEPAVAVPLPSVTPVITATSDGATPGMSVTYRCSNDYYEEHMDDLQTIINVLEGI